MKTLTLTASASIEVEDHVELHTVPTSALLALGAAFARAEPKLLLEPNGAVPPSEPTQSVPRDDGGCGEDRGLG